MSVSDKKPTLETLDFTIHIGSTRTFFIFQFRIVTTCVCASPAIRLTKMICVTKIFVGPQNEIAMKLLVCQYFIQVYCKFILSKFYSHRNILITWASQAHENSPLPFLLSRSVGCWFFVRAWIVGKTVILSSSLFNNCLSHIYKMLCISATVFNHIIWIDST